MKRVWLTLSFFSIAMIAGCGGHWAQDVAEMPMNERDEIKQAYHLKPGATVEVAGIRGTVEVEVIDGDTAQIEVVRTAAKRETLENTKIIVEQTPTSLLVRSVTENDNFVMRLLRGSTSAYQERVRLKVPRQVDLLARGVNGQVTLGAVAGKVHVTGVNGAVIVAPITGGATISGVNGKVTLGLASIGEQGANISGVNGPVELRFAGGANADVQASGVNGRVEASDPGFTVEQDENDHSNFHARIGGGGGAVSLSGINGQVSLRRNAAS